MAKVPLKLDWERDKPPSPEPEVAVTAGGEATTEEEREMAKLSDHKLQEKVHRIANYLASDLVPRLPDKGAKLKQSLRQMQAELDRRKLVNFRKDDGRWEVGRNSRTLESSVPDNVSSPKCTKSESRSPLSFTAAFSQKLDADLHRDDGRWEVGRNSRTLESSEIGGSSVPPPPANSEVKEVVLPTYKVDLPFNPAMEWLRVVLDAARFAVTNTQNNESLTNEELKRELEQLRQEKDSLRRERDSLITEKNSWMTERNSLMQERNQAAENNKKLEAGNFQLKANWDQYEVHVLKEMERFREGYNYLSTELEDSRAKLAQYEPTTPLADQNDASTPSNVETQLS